MCESFDFLSNKEVQLLISTPPKECSICNFIIENYLMHTSETGYYLITSEMDNSDIEHLEQIFNRKIKS